MRSGQVCHVCPGFPGYTLRKGYTGAENQGTHDKQIPIMSKESILDETVLFTKNCEKMAWICAKLTYTYYLQNMNKILPVAINYLIYFIYVLSMRR